MADVQTFRAATMREALDLVRRELGADAVILHTRQIEHRRFLPWRKPAEEVEITASLTLDVAPATDRKRPARTTARTAKRPQTSPAGGPDSTPASGLPPRPPHRAAGRPAAQRLDLVSEPSESVADILNKRTDSPGFRVTPPGGVSASYSNSTARRASRPADEPFGQTVRRNQLARRSETAVATAEDRSDPTAALSRRLDAIQQMLQDLGRSTAAVRHEEIPNELFHLYAELIDAEVEDEVARELIVKLKRSASPRQLTDAASAKALLTAMVEAEIHCCEPISPKPGRRKVVALVGATGVGKTTTIAKLAANFRLRSPVKMGLVTVDTYRVAAVEQLRTYAEIIDLPMKVVTNPLEMRRAVDEFTGLDLVLIDTAGRSPKDELQIQDLKALLAEARVDEIDLVLSMTSSFRSLEACAAKFAAAGTTSLILTKLDEASGMGPLLSIARKIPLPIRYLTAGQDVPDDIEPAHPRRVARLVLGQERAAR